jgi:hypothetical protein
MSDLLLSFILLRPLVALAENTFGNDLVLGNEINLPTVPFQRLRTFVSVESGRGSLIVVGRLASFKIVEDLVSFQASFFSPLF